MCITFFNTVKNTSNISFFYAHLLVTTPVNANRSSIVVI
ncbi:hypothetical protein GAGA_2186 [Paraglaciecola agarilytica NO2]|uniref:Uncharacterized protein n=1 Tax=Paraglaciecola agarilytica NO2 TaxID=1125747 RepID=A0ABQ0I7J2_9ALTE|nr:hypothetical protein GAGA_2186 [Paraglaciecola agarilytica NO2]